MSNFAGGLSTARKQFLKDVQSDKDYIEYREKSQSEHYGTATVYEDPFAKTETFRKLVKAYEKATEYQTNRQKKNY